METQQKSGIFLRIDSSSFNNYLYKVLLHYEMRILILLSIFIFSVNTMWYVSDLHVFGDDHCSDPIMCRIAYHTGVCYRDILLGILMKFQCNETTIYMATYEGGDCSDPIGDAYSMQLLLLFNGFELCYSPFQTYYFNQNCLSLKRRISRVVHKL